MKNFQRERKKKKKERKKEKLLQKKQSQIDMTSKDKYCMKEGNAENFVFKFHTMSRLL